jgi:hypothetical protein
MTIDRALAFSILVSTMLAAGAGPALAQACSRDGADVSCGDGRRDLFSGDAII